MYYSLGQVGEGKVMENSENVFVYINSIHVVTDNTIYNDSHRIL